MKSIKKIHFMGIGGSGAAGVAKLSERMGYKVSGCDIESGGHSASHLAGIDLVVTTPAVYYQSKGEDEYKLADKKGILISWQEFLGKYLMKEKKVIAVCGTHGKSTTTAMAVKLLTDNGFDPSAVLGAKLIPSGENYRYGKGEYFVVEADEFNDNFLNYHPEIIILNNIEFDHPDYFKNQDQVFESFRKFISNLRSGKILITNTGAVGIKKLLSLVDTNDFKLIDAGKNKKSFNLKVMGEHNIQNALNVFALGEVLGISEEKITRSLESFPGVGRRMELLGEKNGIKVYDDYAHHPTAIKATLKGLRDKYPKRKIWAIIEPHGYARTSALLKDYKSSFDDSEASFVGPIFKARDKKTFGITPQKVAEASGKKDAFGKDSFEEIKKIVLSGVMPGDVVIVMGAGRSNLWAKELLKNLK